MAVDIVLALAGLVLLLVGSDWLVAGGSRLAARRGIPPVVVGAVILGFGTSVPELVVGLAAGIRGDASLGLGGIVGSNAANMGLVLGVAALAAPIAADRAAWRRVPLAIGAVLLLAVFLVTGGGVVERWEGGVLLAAMAGATWWLLRDPHAVAGQHGDASGADVPAPSRMDRRIDDAVRRLAPHSRGEFWRLALGLVAIVAGAQLAVDGFTGIAERIGLATALAGIRRRQPLLTLGNLLGSNIFNSLAIGGVITLVRPGGLGSDGVPWVAAGAMFGMILLAMLFLATNRRERRLERWEGGVLLVAYAVALPLILVS